MRSASLVRVRFPFGHFVIEPHYHPDALVELVVSSDVRIDPDHPSHMMGVDGVAVRETLGRWVGATLAGRMLVWDRDRVVARGAPLDVPKGLAPPALLESIWPVRPTIEAVATLVALLCDSAVFEAGNASARIEEIRVFESDRAGCVISAAEVDDAVAFAWSAFVPLFESTVVSFAERPSFR
jgi:hypothetical protein